MILLQDVPMLAVGQATSVDQLARAPSANTSTAHTSSARTDARIAVPGSNPAAPVSTATPSPGARTWPPARRPRSPATSRSPQTSRRPTSGRRWCRSRRRWLRPGGHHPDHVAAAEPCDHRRGRGERTQRARDRLARDRSVKYGTQLEITGQNADWFKIKLPDQREGWVAAGWIVTAAQ